MEQQKEPPPQDPPPTTPSNKRPNDEASQGSGGGWKHYTDEEWAAWRTEQQAKWDRVENASTDQRLFNKELESRCNDLRAEQERLKKEVKGQKESLMAIGEMAVRSDQRRKEDDIELAVRQIRIGNWNGEDERERRVAISRWCDHMGVKFDRINTLHVKGTSNPLHFTLLTLGSKEERDRTLQTMSSSPVWGLRGTRLWSSKNIAKFQREGGEWIRFMMTALNVVLPGTKLPPPHWEFDAIELDGQWLVATVPDPSNSRNKCIAYNRALLSGDAFSTACGNLWKTWGGYGSRWTDVRPKFSEAASSSADISTWQQVSAASARTHYLQDWWTYNTTPLTAEIASVLDAAKKEKEERDEQRFTKRKTGASKRNTRMDEDTEAENPNSSAAAVARAKAALNGEDAGGDHTLGPPNPFRSKSGGGPPRVAGVDDPRPLDESSFAAWTSAKKRMEAAKKGDEETVDWYDNDGIWGGNSPEPGHSPFGKGQAHSQHGGGGKNNDENYGGEWHQYQQKKKDTRDIRFRDDYVDPPAKGDKAKGDKGSKKGRGKGKGRGAELGGWAKGWQSGWQKGGKGR